MRESREGQRVPDVRLAEMADGEVRTVHSAALFNDRRVILFALPGAWPTSWPTPSSRGPRCPSAPTRREHRDCRREVD